MGLLTQNMKPCVSCNEGTSILMASWNVVPSPPWEQRKRWVPLNLKANNKCNEWTYELKDGGGPT
jgi:hypothetical protein